MDIDAFLKEEFVGGKTYVTVSIPEEADEIAYKTITYSTPVFLPPVTLSELNGEQIFSYDVTADRFLRVSMLPNAMTPLEFLTFMKNITDAVVNCDDYFMSPLNLLINEEYLYVNTKSFDVRLLYVPFTESVCTDTEINSQVFKISRRFAKTNGLEWQGVITRLWNMSESTSVYDANEMFTSLYNEYSRNEASSGAIQREAIQRETPYHTEEKAETTRDVQQEPVKSKKAGLFSKKPETVKQSSGAGKFSGKPFEATAAAAKENKPDKKIKEKPEKPVKEAKGGFFSSGNKHQPAVFTQTIAQQSNTTARQQPNEDDNTQPPRGAVTWDESDDTTQPPRGAMLVSSARFDYSGGKNDKELPQTIRVELQDGKFTIGRIKNGKNTCDFTFSDKTPGVSHIHARVTQRNGIYYITDLNSTYGTFVDHCKIEPMREVELKGGEEVSFSSEVDYLFNIERGR